ncbi:hypothetical protein L596_015230 [Steinernema carpocapsae]|uniref:Uncharacterized protein n=1 Tax=Steinernema carpocapsae TaxID=34508 RepID=A0A4U5NEC8_STECR|nr:hypothetical protein L596_015230 [Steinernema carpocapsae]
MQSENNDTKTYNAANNGFERSDNNRFLNRPKASTLSDSDDDEKEAHKQIMQKFEPKSTLQRQNDEDFLDLSEESSDDEENLPERKILRLGNLR